MARIRTLTSAMSICALALVVAACGGSDSGSEDSKSTKTSGSKQSASSTATLLATGTEFTGDTSDGGAVKLVLEEGPAARFSIEYTDSCANGGGEQQVDLGPFPIEDGELQFANPGGDGSSEATGTLKGETFSGTYAIAAYDDDKRGACKAVDLTWEAKVSKRAVVASGDGGAFEPGAELVSSNFDGDAADGWTTANTAEFFTGVEDGEMRLSLRTKGVAGVPQEGDGLAKLSDVVASATVTLRAGDKPNDTVGMACRQDAPWGYSFYVAKDGKIGIFDGDGETLRPVKTGTLEDPIEIGTPFQIGIACVGTRLQLFVDDKLVLDGVDDDGGSWPNGRVALLLSGNAKTDAVFDDVTVSEPKR